MKSGDRSTNQSDGLVNQPVFLVGAERSGTTVLRLMLAHHPLLAWCQEFEYAVAQMVPEYPALDQYYQWLETHRVFQASGFQIDRHLNYPQLVNSFLVQQRDRQGKPLVGATVHHHFDRVLRIWSDARFIHLVRDGRDVARSCIGMGWAGNVWTGLERWIEAERLWEKLKAELPATRYLELKYESLIAEPTAALTNLCDFIGIPYDEAMLSYHQSSTYDLPDASFIQQWRRKLTEREIQLVEARIGQMLEERGYQRSDLPPLTVTPRLEKQLRQQDWRARLQFRFQRYGVALVLSDFLARRLGIKQWQKPLKLKLNAIEKAHLK